MQVLPYARRADIGGRAVAAPQEACTGLALHAASTHPTTHAVYQQLQGGCAWGPSVKVKGAHKAPGAKNRKAGRAKSCCTCQRHQQAANGTYSHTWSGLAGGAGARSAHRWWVEQGGSAKGGNQASKLLGRWRRCNERGGLEAVPCGAAGHVVQSPVGNSRCSRLFPGLVARVEQLQGL